ncbi:MAG: hypothetical protein WCP20_04215 [Desulfuromonadales bacterium]
MKSSWNDDGTYSVQVDGDWTVCTVTNHLQIIAAQSFTISDLSLHFSKHNPAGKVITELDLNGITSIDDSGFRILHLWQEHLKKQGFNPVIMHRNPDFCQRISGT